MDIEKTMEFILEQQGEFAVHIGELREQQATSAQQIETLGQAVRDQLRTANPGNPRGCGQRCPGEDESGRHAH